MESTRRGFLGAAAATAWTAQTKAHSAADAKFFVAALTMLDRSGQLDDALTKDYLAYLAENGADGVLALGTTGEFPSFSVRERKAILESFLRHRKKLTVMCHVGTSNVPETLELLDHAASADADMALVVPPFYYKKPSLEGLVRFYEPILRRAKIPVLLYNIPQLSGVTITPELLRRLSVYDTLYGMKDSFSPAEKLVETIREFPKLKIYTGRTDNIEADLRAGGSGVVSGNGSIFPRETAAILEAFRTHGDLTAAQQQLNDVSAAIRGYGGIASMKFALSRFGLRESSCRAPFVELSPAQKSEVAERLRRIHRPV